MGIEGFGVVFVIIILFSSATFANAVPPSQNPGIPFDDILAELADVKNELSEIKDITNIIRSTVSEAYDFELKIPDTVGGATTFILHGTCAPEAEPCALFSIEKIITPDAGILPVYVLLCTDVLVCHILHGEDDISIGISGGIAAGLSATTGIDINLHEPLISPLPINLLFASGLGEVKALTVVTLTNLPGYGGTDEEPSIVRFIGEKPLDVTLTGAYIDLDDPPLHCFDKDGASVDCTPVKDSLLNGDICFDTDLFPIPGIEDLESVIGITKEDFDLGVPESATECEICLDGSLTCPVVEIPLIMKSSPLQSCTLNLVTDSIECTPFLMDLVDISDEDVLQVIKDIKKTVDDIKGLVDGIPAGASDTFDDITSSLDDVFDCIINGNNCAD